MNAVTIDRPEATPPVANLIQALVRQLESADVRFTVMAHQLPQMGLELSGQGCARESAAIRKLVRSVPKDISLEDLVRDTGELIEVLRDIALGADMMLQPGVATGAFASYAREVKRVALASIARVTPLHSALPSWATEEHEPEDLRSNDELAADDAGVSGKDFA